MKLRKGIGITLFLLLPVGLAQQARAQVVGELLVVSGQVQIQRDGKRQPGAMLHPLRKGDRIVVAPKARATAVLYRSRVRYQLASSSVGQVLPDQIARISGVSPHPLPPLPSGLLRSGAAPVLQRGNGLLGLRVRGSDGPEDPWPRCGARQQNIVLRWRDMEEIGTQEETAPPCVLQIREEASGRIVYRNEAIPRATRHFQVPAGILKPGFTYIWSVAKSRRSQPRCVARMWLLTPAECADVARAERAADKARQADMEDGTPDLLLGQIYARYGLYVEAMDAYQTAQRAGVDSPQITKTLAQWRSRLGN